MGIADASLEIASIKPCDRPVPAPESATACRKIHDTGAVPITRAQTGAVAERGSFIAARMARCFFDCLLGVEVITHSAS